MNMNSYMNQREVDVRYAKWEDGAQIAGFNRAMALETEDKKLDPAISLAGVEAVLKDSQHGFYLVTELEGKVVGSLLITYEWSDWRNRQIWWIQSVYLLREARGKGLFSRMFDAVKTRAQEKGVTDIRLYVEKENHHAQKVYQKLGMDDAGYFMYRIDLSEKG